MQITVSVIIPNYNHALYLKKRIDSVLCQSYIDFEVIILDDCSTDNSKDVIEAYRTHPKVSHIIYNETNSGSTFKQWNKGLSLARGQFIWVAESDDVADSDFLKKMIEPLFNTENIGLVFCQSYQFNENDESTGTWKFHTHDIISYNWETDFQDNGKSFIVNAMMFKNSIVNASAVVFRKSLVNKSDFIDTNMTLNGDWLFYIKCLLKADVFFVSEPLNYFRAHNNKGSSSNIKNFNNVKEYYYILAFLFSHIKVSHTEKSIVKENVFNIWYYQADGKFNTIFNKQFIPILKNAYKVDKTILLRFTVQWFKKRSQNLKNLFKTI